MLSDVDIKNYMDEGGLDIQPRSENMIQPASIDLRLSDSFRTFNDSTYTFIDPKLDQKGLTWEQPVGEDGLFIKPGEFLLASTNEVVTLPTTLSAKFEGKSSLGRIGLMCHVTAGFIDPGFVGQITLELHNVSPLPIKLRPGMKIGQLCLYKLDTPSSAPYGSEKYASRYQGQMGATASRSHL